MKAEQNTTRILIAGFGGQGVLFFGKWIAYAGMQQGKEVTWLPSYGPEMRGGTANCAVILSRDPIGSPIVQEMDVLIAMNLPSLAAYQSRVRPGGTIFYDASLIHESPSREDVHCFAIPATRLAAEQGLEGLGNMILLGAYLKTCMPMNEAQIQTTLAQVVPAHKQQLISANLRAISLGSEQASLCAFSTQEREKTARIPRKAG